MGNMVVVRSRQDGSPVLNNQYIDFIHALGRDALHTLPDVGSLRSTANFLAQVDFSAAVLRNRLGRCLAAKGLHTIIAFDAQLESPLLLKAIWLVDTQQWTEVVSALKLAVQLGRCHLPVTIAGQDLQRHTTKQAYLAEPRVVAFWKMIGRHVEFGGDLGRFELFDAPGSRMHAIKDEPGYELTLHPTLPGGHPFQAHVHNDNPPIEHRIGFTTEGGGWVAGGARVEASALSFIMNKILDPSREGLAQSTDAWVDRRVNGNRLGNMLAVSVHNPPENAYAVTAYTQEAAGAYSEVRDLLITALDSPIVAYVELVSLNPLLPMVQVRVRTNEADATAQDAQ
ncbi:unnamed protein product [Vitrella brassicaformis CCMP3155]|uniref:Uncharacterized protein n=1 Tax=Vitrella brassicaformis (strain CCMP3155) TaxID=1169540 RepID=A0A0G4FXP0_VITBC|nr:unnamed protein product [Vitrella brassicaformis CCMP3155]|eukprot:CEM20081.1 unnamed protein product [Vitrella brassicaformis CCMP3155]